MKKIQTLKLRIAESLSILKNPDLSDDEIQEQECYLIIFKHMLKEELASCKEKLQ